MQKRQFDFQHTFTAPAGVSKQVQQLSSGQFAGAFDFVLQSWTMVTSGDDVRLRLLTPERRYLDNEAVNQRFILPVGSYLTNYGPVWPPELYPVNSVLELDVDNRTGGDVTLTVIYHGFHLVPDAFDGSVSFPDSFELRRFDYVTQHVLGGNDTSTDNVMHVESDADFLLMGMATAHDDQQALPTALTFALRGQNGQRYSNNPISWLFYSGSSIPERPRAFYPPIHIPANGFLLYDWIRTDGGADAKVTTRWIGAKVLRVCA